MNLKSSILRVLFLLVFLRLANVFEYSEYVKKHFSIFSLDEDGYYVYDRMKQPQPPKPVQTIITDSASSKPFNPWTEFDFESINASSISSIFSSVRCTSVGTDNGERQENEFDEEPRWQARSCWFRNIYYNIKDQTFHYRASPQESKAWLEAKRVNPESFHIELEMRRDLSIGTAYAPPPPRDKTPLTYEVRNPWRTIWHAFNKSTDAYFSENGVSNLKVRGSKSTKTLYLLGYQPTQSDNFGHFMWDDALNTFTLLDNFDLSEVENMLSVPFYIELRGGKRGRGYSGYDPYNRCSPRNQLRWTICSRAYTKFAELMAMDTVCGDVFRTGNWLIGVKSFQHMCPSNSSLVVPANTPQNNDAFVVLPNLLVGIGRSGYSGCMRDCTIGQASRYSRFRSHLFRNLFGWAEGNRLAALEPYGYITFSMPVGSSRPNDVHHFEAEIEATKRLYGEDAVKVVNMVNLTLKEQAKVVLNSTVYFTNMGGGSASSIFLPRGGTQMNFFYGHMIGKGWKRHKFRKRMDHHIYMNIQFFETIYVDESDWMHVNRTMAILDSQCAKMLIDHPNMACKPVGG